jgi:arsenate reductase
LDLVITVCDNAAGEVCPIWPGHPAKVHWSFPDPAAFEGSEADKRVYFSKVFGDIKQAIGRLVALRVETLDRNALIRRAQECGLQ